MATSKSGILGAAVVVLAGVGIAAWLLSTRSSPLPVSRATPRLPPSAPEGPPAATPLKEGTLAPPATGDGVITGRLVRGCAANSVEGMVSVGVNGRAPLVASTFGRGTFRVEGVPTVTTFVLTATSGDLLPAVLPSLRIPAGGILDLGDIELGKGMKVEVQVTQGAGQAVAGATVSLIHEPPRSANDEFGFNDLDPPEDVSPREVLTTPPSGRVGFASVPPGAWMLKVAARGFAPALTYLSLNDGDARDVVRVHLLPAHTLSGTVRSREGKALAGIEVRAWPSGPSSWRGPEVRSSRAGADGRYRIEGLIEGAFVVAVRTSAASMHTVAEVRIPSLASLDIVLDPGVVLRGRVVDDATGSPIAGASVNAHFFQMSGPNRDSNGHTVSLADGTFEIPSLEMVGLGGIKVRKEGFLPAELSESEGKGVASPDGVIVREVRLARGGAVRGRVTDREKRPIQGAEITFLPAEKADGLWLPWSTERFTARSVQDGSFLLPVCPPGKGLVQVKAAGWYQPEWPEKLYDAVKSGTLPESCTVEVQKAGEVEKNIALTRAATVEGTVRDAEGRPRAGCSTEVMKEGTYYYEGGGAPTGDDGAFRIEGALPGERKIVRAWAPGGGSGESKPFEVSPGAVVRDVVVVLKPGGSIAGTVRRQDGAPVLDARIHVNMMVGPADSFDMSMLGMGSSTFVEHADGTYRLDDVSPGEHTVFAYARDCPPVVVRSVAVEEGKVTGGIEIVFPPALRIEGMVVNEGGAPVSGAGVYLEHEAANISTEGILRQVTGGDGKFTLQDLPAGSVVLIVRAAGRPEVRTTVVTGTLDLMVTSEAGRRIAGTVVDSDSGKGIAGVLVVVQKPDTEEDMPALFRSPPPSSKTDSEGKFSVGGLSSGVYRVSLRPEGAPGTADYSPVEIKEVKAGTEDLRVPLSLGLSIAGRLVGGNGEPPPGEVSVSAESEEGTGRRGGFGGNVERDGKFKVTGLTAGNYEVTFRRMEDGASPQTAVSGIAAGTQDLVVRFASGLVIKGRVLDEEGKPPAPYGNGMLRISPSAWQKGESFSTEYVTLGEDGTFTTPVLPSGRKFDVSANGFEGFMDGGAGGVLPGSTDVVILLRRGGTLSGRVLLPDGSPAPAGIVVTATRKTGTEVGSRSSTHTAKDGTFQMTGLGDFEFVVIAGGSESDYAPTLAEGAFRPGATGIEVRLEPGVSVSGRFLDADGKPMKVSALFSHQEGVSANSSFGEQVSSDGLFLVKGLRPGKVTLSVIVGKDHVDLGAFDAPSTNLKVTVVLK